jgi:hypothetical protein
MHHDENTTGAPAPVPDSPGLHARAWWRPFALAVADGMMRGAPVLEAAVMAAAQVGGNLSAHGLPAALATCSTRDWTLRRSIPRDGSPLARALWRQLQFAFGRNLNLGGLFSARAETTDAEYSLAEDVANILAILARGSNAGADRWSNALGYGGGEA